MGGPKPRPEAERFWAKVDKSGPCHLWTAGTNGAGYGYFRVGSQRDGTRRYVLAHVWAWTQANGPVPPGKVLDHVRARGCTSTLCVRLDHLEPVPQGENLLRGNTVNAAHAAKKNCPTCGGEYRRRTDRNARWCPTCEYARRSQRRKP